MGIEEMSNEAILRHLGKRFDSFIFSGARKERSGVKVATLVKGKDYLPFCRDEVEAKVKDLLKEPPVDPPKGTSRFRIIK